MPFTFFSLVSLHIKELVMSWASYTYTLRFGRLYLPQEYKTFICLNLLKCAS